MSNIKREYMALIFQAAYETGFDIYVNENATDWNNQPVLSCVAVHTNEPGRDHGAFWNRYQQLKEEE